MDYKLEVTKLYDCNLERYVDEMDLLYKCANIYKKAAENKIRCEDKDMFELYKIKALNFCQQAIVNNKNQSELVRFVDKVNLEFSKGKDTEDHIVYLYTYKNRLEILEKLYDDILKLKFK